MPSLDLVKGFVAVGRRMSISQAAEDLCLTQSAVSKQIRTLEDILGVQLFNRGFRSLTFTEQGQTLFRVADASVQNLQNVVGLISSPRKRPVTITASTGVSSLWILPRLGEFLAEHPDIDVRFAATNAVLELDDDVELAIRYCSEKQAPVGSIRLFGETIQPVASPDLGLHSFKSAQALQSATLLEFDTHGRPWLQWSDWLAARGWRTADAKAVVRFNAYEQTIQAALAGQGIALGRLELLQPYFEDGRLRVLETPGEVATTSAYAYWLLQAEPHPRDEVRKVVDWILRNARRVA